jgi:hypothetical protein
LPERRNAGGQVSVPEMQRPLQIKEIRAMDRTNRPYNTEKFFKGPVADGAAFAQEDVHGRADFHAKEAPSAPAAEAWARHAASANGFGDAAIPSEEPCYVKRAGSRC